jgi:uncharacterized protein (DUF427 family)
MTVSRGLVRTEPCAKRVRIYLGGQLIAATLAPLLVWEIPCHPTYYFPVEDVHAELFPTARSGTRQAGETAACSP